MGDELTICFDKEYLKLKGVRRATLVYAGICSYHSISEGFRDYDLGYKSVRGDVCKVKTDAGLGESTSSCILLLFVSNFKLFSKVEHFRASLLEKYKHNVGKEYVVQIKSVLKKCGGSK